MAAFDPSNLPPINLIIGMARGSISDEESDDDEEEDEVKKM